MNEPEFIAQTAEPMSSAERLEWIRAQAGEARTAGMTFGRASIHPEQTNIVLYEGWRVQPKDQGEPRFQIRAEPTP